MRADGVRPIYETFAGSATRSAGSVHQACGRMLTVGWPGAPIHNAPALIGTTVTTDAAPGQDAVDVLDHLHGQAGGRRAPSAGAPLSVTNTWRHTHADGAEAAHSVWLLIGRARGVPGHGRAEARPRADGSDAAPGGGLCRRRGFPYAPTHSLHVGLRIARGDAHRTVLVRCTRRVWCSARAVRTALAADVHPRAAPRRGAAALPPRGAGRCHHGHRHRDVVPDRVRRRPGRPVPAHARLLLCERPAFCRVAPGRRDASGALPCALDGHTWYRGSQAPLHGQPPWRACRRAWRWTSSPTACCWRVAG